MVRQSALTARYPRLLAGPLMGDAFGVRRFAATAGDLTQSGSIEQCESSEMFGGHGALVQSVGYQLARRITRDFRSSPSARGPLAADASSKRSARATCCAKAEPLVLSKITGGLTRPFTGRDESS
jgi:hypothetical protein